MTSYVNYAMAKEGGNVEQEARLADMAVFLEQFKISINKKKRRQLLEMSLLAYESYKIGIEISHCCRDMDLERAYQSFQRVKDLQLRVPMHTYNNLLCLIAGLGELGHGSNTHRNGPVPYNLQYARDIYDYVVSLPRDSTSSTAETATAEVASESAEAVKTETGASNTGTTDVVAMNDATVQADEQPVSEGKNELIFSEAAYSALIRCHCLHQQLDEAFAIYQLLDQSIPRINLKQRTYTTLLYYYATQGNTKICEDLWQDMSTKDHVIASEKEYCSMLQLYLLTQQHEKFIGMLLEMMEELCYLQHEETLDVIRSFFEVTNTSEKSFETAKSMVSVEGIVACNQLVLPSLEIENNHLQGLLSQLQSIAINRDPNHKYKPNNKIRDYISAQKQLKASSNTAPVAPVVVVETAPVDPVVIAKVTETTTTMTNTASKYNNSTEDRKAKWDNFVNFLRNRQEAKSKKQQTTESDEVPSPASKSRSFDIIIDGANVGYYNQNYAGAPTHVDYIQIYQMVNYIIGLGYSPLIIIHSRHFSDHILKTVQMQPYHYQDHSSGESGTFHTVYDVVNAMRKTGNLYVTPKGFNDDWFWMYAAVKYCLPVITNDEMRDHHFELLSPRYFTRWRERHRVMFEFFFRRNQPTQPMCQDQQDKKESTGNESSSDEDDDDNPYEAKKEVKFDPQTRRPKVCFPLKFSYRMQYLDTEDHEGYYFPPLLSVVEDHKSGDDKKTQQPSSMLVSEELLEAYEKVRFQHEWLCIFRKKTNKRPRDEDFIASGLGPNLTNEEDDVQTTGPQLKLQRQITKDINN